MRATILALTLLGAVPFLGAAPDALPPKSYGSFAAARDTAERILRGALGPLSRAAVWTRDSVDFTYRRWDGDSLHLASLRVPGWTMMLDDTSGSARDLDAVLKGEGWKFLDEYGADGADGTIFALGCREAMCHFQVGWDGGDDTDSTYVPAPGQWFEVSCVPRYDP